MEFNLDTSGDTQILTLRGELTISHASILKNILLKSLEGDKVIIKLKNVTDVDLSCLQLLCSAHRSAIKAGKQIIVNCKESDIFRQTMFDAGFCPYKDCEEGSDKNCFWSENRQIDII